MPISQGRIGLLPLLGPKRQFLFNPVSLWPSAGHRLTDWWATTFQLAIAAAVDNPRATISACCTAVWMVKF